MKPLYLEGVKGMTVNYDEPALTVSVPNKTRLLFPLSRVSRVVVTGPVDWSMPALLSCADAGVSIVFMRETGEVRGQWLGCRRKGRNWAQLFSGVLQRPDVADRYRDWLAGMQRMGVRSAARRLGFADWRDADAATLTTWLNRSQHRTWRCVNGWLQGFLLSTVLQELEKLGLDARSECWRDQCFNVPGDFCGILFWDFYPALLRWQSRCQEPPEHRDVIAFYEQRKRRTGELLRGTIHKWHQWLLSVS